MHETKKSDKKNVTILIKDNKELILKHHQDQNRLINQNPKGTRVILKLVTVACRVPQADVDPKLR